MMDYYTIIGRDPKLFRGHVADTIKNAGLDRDQWTFNVIIYHNNGIPRETTEELIEICEQNDIVYVMLHEDPREPFIYRLYRAWNMGYDIGRHPLVFRGGSDQTWSEDAFAFLLDYYNAFNGEVVLQAQTVESPAAGATSRHFVKDFGTNFETYKEEEFQAFAKEQSVAGLFTIKDALDIWGHPTHFNSSISPRHNRTDGCSWLQSRKLFLKHGPMPAIEGSYTGDVIIHDRYERAGIPNRLAGDVFTYHFVRGESAGHGQ